MVPLAGNWWFWALVGVALAIAVALSGPYRSLAAAIRSGARRRGIVQLPRGHGLAPRSGRFWSDPSWMVLLIAAWVIAGPWIWGYDDVSGAIATDVLTGSAVIVIALGAVVFPALWALELFAGLWLVPAPWLVGYGNENGPAGLSDSISGVLICAIALICLSAAERAVRPHAGERAIGRIRPPRD